jgi:hypothetical protein
VLFIGGVSFGATFGWGGLILLLLPIGVLRSFLAFLLLQR